MVRMEQRNIDTIIPPQSTTAELQRQLDQLDNDCETLANALLQTDISNQPLTTKNGGRMRRAYSVLSPESAHKRLEEAAIELAKQLHTPTPTPPRTPPRKKSPPKAPKKRACIYGSRELCRHGNNCRFIHEDDNSMFDIDGKPISKKHDSQRKRKHSPEDPGRNLGGLFERENLGSYNHLTLNRKLTFQIRYADLQKSVQQITGYEGCEIEII